MFERLGVAQIVILAIPAVLIAALWTWPLIARSQGSRMVTETPQKRDGMLSRILVTACGVKRPFLESTRGLELSHYQAMGAAVILTSLAAVSSMSLALTLAFPRAPWWQVGGIGLLYGAFIYNFDRALTSMPLNSPAFPEGPALARTPRRRRVLQLPALVRIMPALSIRLAVSVVIGLLVAEPLLLILFEPEIENRVNLMRQEAAREAGEGVRREYEEALQRLAVPEEGADQLDAKEQELASVRTAREEALRRRDEASILRDRECSGEAVTVGGRTASGRRGCGPLAAQHEADMTLAQAEVEQKDRAIEQLSAELAELEQGVGSRERQRRQDLSRKREEMEVAISEAQEEARLVDGLLIRVEALEQLTRDTTPFEIDSEGGADAATAMAGPNPTSPPETREASTAMVLTAASTPPQPAAATPEAGPLGLTTLGRVVWLLRAWLVVLDCAPILLKTMHSLHARRSVDEHTAMAAEQNFNGIVKQLADSRAALQNHFAQLEATAAQKRRELRRATSPQVHGEAFVVTIGGKRHHLTVGGAPLLLGPDRDAVAYADRPSLLYAVPGVDGSPLVVQIARDLDESYGGLIDVTTLERPVATSGTPPVVRDDHSGEEAAG